MTPRKPTFLTAEWRHLAMLNYVVDPTALMPFTPHGTELDFFEGRAYASVVGFRFLRTRVLGVPVPLHTDFDEVNFRFYVRRRADGGWRRGVVFIRELVPRRAIAFIARTFYGEPYLALPMRHRVDLSPAGIRVEYSWRRAGDWESVQASGAGGPVPIEAGSLEEFITDHYWGYTARKKGSSEYEVEHPRWRIWHCTDVALKAEVSTLYGPQFAAALSPQPVSAFIAEGSPVTVRGGSFLEAAPQKASA
jgi:uncharacterized protein